MNPIYSSLHHFLVDQPTILHFHWHQSHTFAASPTFLLLSLLTYLSLTFLLSRSSPNFIFPPPLLRVISILHNLILLLLSLTMALGCSLSSLSSLSPLFPTLLCFPPNHTSPHGPIFFWAHVFYLSKYLEFFDTLLIILGGSASIRRLTFLHVYHHSVVVLMSYLWLYTSMSLMPVALVTNSAVHVLMYAYYLMCALGRRPPWKRAVTDCQIVQFVFSFVVSAVMLYYHFTGLGCSGIWGWCFNAVFNASLLYLFVDFHSKNYARRKVADDKRS